MKKLKPVDSGRNQTPAEILRESKGVLLTEWQKTARSQWPHLNDFVSGAQGLAVQPAARVLDLLTRYQEARHDLAVPPFQTEVYSPLLEQCVLELSALPIVWEDTRRLLNALSAQVRSLLTAQGADVDTLRRTEYAFVALMAAVADRRVLQAEQELATLHEESIITQHLAGRFLANASHELRTPLTAVLGFAELLQEETYGSLTPEQETAVGHIENSAQNLLEIVNNLLDLLHIRAGKLTLKYRPVDVARLLQDLYNILAPLAARKKVRFELHLSDAPGTMEADDNIVRHIVYHLLSSALRATPEEGIVTLSAHRSNTHIVIEVRDTALHLPPEAIANMMESFPRLENSPARGYEGWEVGLPLVRRYVDLHKGQLTLESLPETGTSFCVLLPLTR